MKCESGKVYFRKRHIAEGRAKNLTKETKKENKPLAFRAYKCDLCGGYHLTSIDIKKKQKERKIFLDIETDYWEDKLK